MSTFEILCVTMNQKDFSKIREMNIHSDVIFANQADRTSFDQIELEGHTAKMITTSTRGVGINRNLALTYANADICLFADDDVVYSDNVEETVLNEFKRFPDADIIIFHLDTDSKSRKQMNYKKSKRHYRFQRMPWATFRIAFRLDSVRKANIWFTTLFGGGCIFPSGEDSMWLAEAKRAGLNFYVSDKTIGTVSFAESTWYTGADEKFFYGKGAFYAAVHPRMYLLWRWYFALRTRNMGNMTIFEKLKWMSYGHAGYKKLLSFNEFKERRAKNN